MLISYIRDDKRNPIGCIVALDKNRIGWSVCHPTKDTFNKETGKKIAAGRAKKGRCGRYPNVDLIPIVKNAMLKMEVRAKKYFKN